MKLLKKNLVKASVAASLILSASLTMGTAQAAGAGGDTAVHVTFPEIIVLHYISDLSLDFKAEGGSIKDGEAGSGQTLSASAEFDASIRPSNDPAYPERVKMEVNNVWAVRGITKSGEIGITGEWKENTASHSEGDSSVSAGEISFSPSTIKAPGLFEATKGGVAFALDLGKLRKAGRHTGMHYVISANAI